MSGAVTPARRLLALLEEEASLETRPRDEVAADLAALGLDPAGPILLARRLADRSAGPAAALLGAVIDDEAAEAEIAALESADIGDVRSRLQIGTVAAVTAEARRRAGAPSNVVGFARYRRGAFWAWTGSLVGMAACVLIVVAAWWPQSELPAPALVFEVEQVPPDEADLRVGRSAPATRLEASTAASSPEPPPVIAREALPPEPEPNPPLVAARPNIQEDIDSAGSVELDDFGESVTEAAPQTAVSIAAGAGPAAVDSVEGYRAERQPDESALSALSAAPPLSRLSPDPAAPPLPPPTPDERRSIVRGLAVAPPAATVDPASLADVSARFRADPSQSPSGNPEDLTQGLVADLAPASAAQQPLVTDMIIFPQSLGLDLDESWADGAFPILIDVQVAGGSTAEMLGIVAEIPSTTADLAGVIPMPLAQGVTVGIDPDLAETRRVESEFRVTVSKGVFVMLSDSGSDGIGDWHGQVGDRLVEARRFVEDRTIIALLTIRSGGPEFDAALVRGDAGEQAASDQSMRQLLRHWFGDDASNFALIVIPGR